MNNIFIKDFGNYDAVIIWDVGKIVQNYNMLNKITNKTTAAVVKNQLYGAPLDGVLPALLNNDCRIFFVASVIEAIEINEILRLHDVEYEIYTLNGFLDDHFDVFIRYNIYPCVNTLAQLIRWNALLMSVSKKSKCMLHIDSGMRRDGISFEDAQKLSLHWHEYTNATEISHYMSHFYGIKDDCVRGNSCNDGLHEYTYEKQIKEFNKIVDLLPKRPISFSATDAILELYHNCDGDGFFEDLPRPGTGLIGSIPSMKHAETLSQVFELYARISSIIHIKKGDNIGYGVNIAAKDMVIAIANIGYGDGYMKILTGYYCAINGLRCIILQINLNCTIIDITDAFPVLPENLIDDIYVELAGPNVDLRPCAIADGCYQIFHSIGKNSHNVLKIVH